MAQSHPKVERQPRGDELLTGIIAKYNELVSKSVAGIELEIRLNPMSAEEFAALLKNARKQYGAKPAERTVNIIIASNNNTNAARNIITYTYRAGMLSPEKSYMSKTQVHPTVRSTQNGHEFRVGLSKETPLPPFAAVGGELVRYKVRYSFDIEVKNKWRLDMTIVKSAHVSAGNQTELARIRDIMMRHDDTILPQVEDAVYEVEMELISAEAPIRVGDFEIVTTLYSLINPTHMQDMLYQQAVYNAAILAGVSYPRAFLSPTRRLKQLAPQVIALSRITYRDLGGVEGFWATLKLDGERCLAHLANGTLTIILSNSLLTYAPAADDDAASATTPRALDATLIDCEMMGDAKSGYTLHAFDVIKIAGADPGEGIGARIAHLPRACDLIAPHLPAPNKCVPKDYVHITNAARDIPPLWVSASGVATDGLIFSKPGKSYMDTKHYKWKPTEHNTIDFMIVNCPASLAGTPPYVPPRGADGAPPTRTYLLCVGINHTLRRYLGIRYVRGHKEIFAGMGHGDYGPIPFAPSMDPLAYIWYSDIPDLHGRVGEFAMSGSRECSNCTWEFRRLREDRKIGANYFGNDYRIAERIYMNYVDDFPISGLWGDAGDTYFTKTADASYASSNGYKRAVITSAFNDAFKDVSMVFDAAAGRGADLQRYRRMGAGRLLVVDIDPAAIAELVSKRKYPPEDDVKKGRTGAGVYVAHPSASIDEVQEARLPDAAAPEIYAAVMDLSHPAADLLSRCTRFGYRAATVTAFTCNFALHYLCTDENTLSNFFSFAGELMAPGSRAVFTVMDGAKIVAAMKGGRLSISAGKYAINMVAGKAAPNSHFGRMIEVKLPFTDKMLREPLCYIDAVVAVAAKYRLRRLYVRGFGEYLDEIRRASPKLVDSLSPGDLEYISLHSCIVFERQTRAIAALPMPALPVAPGAAQVPANIAEDNMPIYIDAAEMVPAQDAPEPDKKKVTRAPRTRLLRK